MEKTSAGGKEEMQLQNTVGRTDAAMGQNEAKQNSFQVIVTIATAETHGLSKFHKMILISVRV